MAKKKTAKKTARRKVPKSAGLHLRDTSVGARRNASGTLEVATRCGKWVDRGGAVRAVTEGVEVCAKCETEDDD